MKGRHLKRLRGINEWNRLRLTEFGFFQGMYTSIGMVVGKVALFSFECAPGLLGTLYVSVIIFGFGFSILLGTPRNKGIVSIHLV